MGILQTVSIPCKGGLNLAATQHDLLSTPNEAIQLVNMEPSKSGGYRRISGYEEWGTISVPGTEEVKGVYTYRGGILCAKGTVLWHSFTGTEWTQVNKSAPTPVDQATLATLGTLNLSETNELPLQIDMYTDGTSDHLYIATGNSDPVYLLITGDSEATATYTYRQVALGGELTGAKWLTIFEGQVILANTTADPSSFIFSSFATTDLTAAEATAGLTVREKYDGSTAGIISVKRPITGIKAHRDTLYIFTRDTISRVQGLRAGNAQVLPVTNDIGCIDGNTIQEIGGDLVFLSSDGIRTVSQTERNDDVELGVISRNIAPITDYILENLEVMTFSSTVIREKNQYRLWYTNSNLPVAAQRGIIASYVYNPPTKSFGWEYAETEGWEVSVVHSGETLDNREFLVHGDATGKVYQLESGGNFNGTKVRWVYQSPYTDLGDIGVRKNIHDVKVIMKPEGDVNAQLFLKYDYQSSDTAQPAPYPLDEQNLPAIFGDLQGGFGNPLIRFGSSAFSDTKVYTEGSGFTVSFIVRDRDLEDSAFEIQAIQLNFTPSGRI
jgi:hypothetical protein